MLRGTLWLSYFAPVKLKQLTDPIVAPPTDVTLFITAYVTTVL